MNWLETILDPCKVDREALQVKLKHEQEERKREERFMIHVIARQNAVDKRFKIK